MIQENIDTITAAAVPLPSSKRDAMLGAFDRARHICRRVWRGKPKPIDMTLRHRNPESVMQVWRDFQKSNFKTYLEVKVRSPVHAAACLGNFLQHFLDYSRGFSGKKDSHGAPIPVSDTVMHEARGAYFGALKQLAELTLKHPEPQSLTRTLVYHLRIAMSANGVDAPAVKELAIGAWEYMLQAAMKDRTLAREILPQIAVEVNESHLLRLPMKQTLARWLQAEGLGKHGGVARFENAVRLADIASQHVNRDMLSFALSQMAQALPDLAKEPRHARKYLKAFIKERRHTRLIQGDALSPSHEGRHVREFLIEVIGGQRHQTIGPRQSLRSYFRKAPGTYAGMVDVAAWLHGQLKNPTYRYESRTLMPQPAQDMRKATAVKRVEPS
jgi:hypothetical protein